MSEPADISTLSFEQAWRTGADRRAPGERPEAPMEASIAMYERGAALKAHCETRHLEAARLRVEDCDGRGQRHEVEPAEFS